MGFRRLGVVAGVLALAMAVVGGAPAVADDVSSICSVRTDPVMGTSDTVMGIRLEAIDCAGQPIGFHGTVSIAHVEDANRLPQVLGVATPETDISGTGSDPGVATFDVSDMPAGQARVVSHLTAVGDDVEYVPPAWDQSNQIGLVRGPGWASSAFTDQTNGGGVVSYEYMRAEQAIWGCDTLLLQDGACVLNAPTTSDRTWQKGYRLTMSWPDPGSDSDGVPYDRCRVWSGTWLSHTSYDTPFQGTFSSTYSVVLDVPAGWGSYTLPLGKEVFFPTSVVPGTSTIDVHYWCYTDAAHGRRQTGTQTAANQLVPDLPPTQPSTVDATSADGTVQADASGSIALGTAPVTGYDMSVVDASGAVLDSATVAPGASDASGVQPMMRTAAVQAKAATHTFRGLKPGSYSVRVASFNSVGASDAVSSRVITVGAAASTGAPITKPKPKPALSAPRKAHVAHAHGRYRVSWASPAATGGGIARYTVAVQGHGHTVQKATVRSSNRSFTIRHVAVTGKYRVVITAVAKDGRTKAFSKTCTLKR